MNFSVSWLYTHFYQKWSHQMLIKPDAPGVLFGVQKIQNILRFFNQTFWSIDFIENIEIKVGFPVCPDG